MIRRQRPMSPFFSAYAWRYTFLNPSVIHRATGVALAVGLIALCYFFVALASGIQAYSRASAIFGNLIFKVFILGWLDLSSPPLRLLALVAMQCDKSTR
jgi:succinate dehydrogenase / fumarate reductase, cytochrome b subunit